LPCPVVEKEFTTGLGGPSPELVGLVTRDQQSPLRIERQAVRIAAGHLYHQLERAAVESHRSDARHARLDHEEAVFVDAESVRVRKRTSVELGRRAVGIDDEEPTGRLVEGTGV